MSELLDAKVRTDGGDRDGSVGLLEQHYRRYKAVALAVGARLALGQQPDDDVLAEVDRLVAECERAALQAGHLREHFDACTHAAVQLRALAAQSRLGQQPVTAARVHSTRASHRQLRRLVWQVTDCEYVPCSGHPAERGA